MKEITFYSQSRLHATVVQIAACADDLERHASWPSESLERLAQVGVMSWGIAPEFGGQTVSALTQTQFYLDCSRACLTTAFVLSQRGAALSRLNSSSNESLKQSILPDIASGKLFATVGISHLSTSRQHLRQPAVLAEPTSQGYRLNGSVPWITGGLQADWVVTGGQLQDGRQILAALKTDQSGVSASPAADMLALNGSATGTLELTDVVIPDAQSIAGPMPEVMKSGAGGTGSLTTSTLALGVAGRAVAGLLREAEQRPFFVEQAESFANEWEQIVQELFDAQQSDSCIDPQLNSSIRLRANSLVQRSAQAYLTAVKGAGFISGHPAQRTIREAMFFLVWSCPQPVAEATLKQFACTPSWD